MYNSNNNNDDNYNNNKFSEISILKLINIWRTKYQRSRWLRAGLAHIYGTIPGNSKFLQKKVENITKCKDLLNEVERFENSAGCYGNPGSNLKRS